jgi:hypothetical protein
MKFLIINRPNGKYSGFSDDTTEVKQAHSLLKAAIESGDVKAAYVLHSGGHAYVVDADSSEDLAIKVRYNPLFRSSDTEIIPVEDALTYLAGYASHLEAVSAR